jgi:hypothetical protein
VGHKRLSEYKTGMGRHGSLKQSDLVARYLEIAAGLKRAGLPAASPIADPSATQVTG